MESVVLDDIPFSINYSNLLRRLQLKENSKEALRLKEMVDYAQTIGRPKGIYKGVFIESKGEDYIIVNNITLKSKILRVNLDQVHKIYPYVITSGIELEEWEKSINDFLESYWVSEIQERVLRIAIKYVYNHIKEHYLPGLSSSMNPGSLVDWSIREQEKLFWLLGDPEREIGVKITDSSLMIPAKSVSGIRYAAEVSFENCQLCSRPDCPSRSAPYNEKLFKEKYNK